MRVTAGC